MGGDRRGVYEKVPTHQYKTGDFTSEARVGVVGLVAPVRVRKRPLVVHFVQVL